MSSLTTYPVGQTWIFDIGEAQIEHRFGEAGFVRYRVLTGPRAGAQETVPIEVRLIRPGVFLVSWQEGDRITVVHVEDYDQLVFYSLVTRPDGTFVRFSGTMKRQT
jgi:molybdenum cofactor biosynthesis MoaF-like protein